MADQQHLVCRSGRWQQPVASLFRRAAAAGGNDLAFPQQPDAATAFPGRASLTARLAADGTRTLQVGDASAVTGKAVRLLARQPQEDFCLAHDSAHPVANYTAKEPYKGSVTALKITTP